MNVDLLFCLFFFSSQEPLNEHTMRSVRQFLVFNLTFGIVDLFGAGGQNSKENYNDWLKYFWHDRSPYICEMMFYHTPAL